MNFVHPVWLAVGMAACLAVLLSWRRYDARQRRALSEFLSAHLSEELTRSMSSARRRLKRCLFTIGLALLFAALAEPQVGFHWEQVQRRGNDILFAVDTSRSMLTPDVKPNRLTRAKLAIDDFIGRLDGDAVGLVAFAGGAFLQCPLTLDYGAFHESLAALDTHIIPRGGTDISSAIEAAQSAVRNRAGADKILILLTDGEDLEGNALETARAAAKESGLKIYTVGVGTANGDLIPLPAEQGGGFLKDGQGHFVRSHLDEAALRAIARATGGSYTPLGPANQGLDLIYRQAIAPLAKHDLASRSEKVYIERYQWPLAGCLVFLLASMLVGTRRSAVVKRTSAADQPMGAAGRATSSNANSRAAVASAAIMALIILMPGHSVHASSVSAAASAYQQGDYARAQSEYSTAAARDPAQPILKFNAGAAAYKAGDFPLAARQFQATLGAAKSGSAERLAQQQDAYYNLGNTLYREGQKTEKSDSQKTMQTWTGALKAYDAALQLRPNDSDSKFNREVVARQLQELKKRQQQSQQGAGSQGQPQQAHDRQQGSPQQQQGSPQQQQGSPQQQQGSPQQGSRPGQQAGSPQQSQPQQAAAQQQPQQGQSSPPSSPGESGAAPKGPLSSAANSRGSARHRADDREEDAPRVPGQMSPEEARELLDSVKDEERRAPAAQNTTANAAAREPSRDW